MKYFQLTLLAAGFFAATSSVAQVKIVVNRGQQFKAESALATNTSSEVMGQSMTSTTDIKSNLVYEITDVNNEGITLTSTITKMVANSNTMGQDMSFNSEDPSSSGPMADMMRPTINKSRNIVVDNKGSITKQDEDSDSPQQAMTGLGDLNNTTTDLFVPDLIGKPLNAGDIIPVLNNFKKDKYSSRDSGSYVVKSIENGIAGIIYNGTQIVNATIEQMGMEMQTSSNNTMNTALQVDVNTGLVLSKTTTITINSTVNVAGMSIPATGTATFTVKVTPVR